ncbi:dihydroneopterin aldolase [Moritella viscosa]|uniref:7,8-dihydroneopterin aldolase n=1 Tax=Moritella viscosa TaxID=80854 RepID=A0A090I9E6_9GAMM|nr:dihydroneopterin aldolase [Moritella viscosa]CED58525.1 dihydroneopterin aldolase [Moritella viscosa]SGY82262.1 Putative Dihydroneopterin aldolase [Moritella viscosa]SGY82535.1 Putative Dihydroneopterin aldolase [Moritella viscosa]SGY82570.1 Putative Dihydroneopterin aldolase [Moritella viscosa]SGY82736.1 Putative Dihydroneopterin aldolase [Moritella viscosa]
MDIVFIEKLEVFTTIGVYDWEKKIIQRLVFDLKMAHDNRPSALTDDITKALDYSAVSKLVTDFAQSNIFELVETMAEQVAELLMTTFGIPWISLKLSKPGAVANAATVGVYIERGQRDGTFA